MGRWNWLAFALPLVACGAPSDPVGYPTLSPTEPPPTARPSTPAPTPTATSIPTPTPTPVPWDDFAITAATLSGDGIDAFLSLEDEANELVVAVVDELVEVGTLSQAEGRAVKEAAKKALDDAFTKESLNDSLSAALSNGTLDVSERYLALGGGAFTLQGFVWNLGDNPASASVGTLSGQGDVATGRLAVPVSISTLSATVTTTVHVEQARIKVAPLSNNTGTGLVPFEDLEALFTQLAVTSIEGNELTPEQIDDFEQRLAAALSGLESQYATQTLGDGRSAMAIDARFDAKKLPNGSKPY